jgi:hypothetical protein
MLPDVIAMLFADDVHRDFGNGKFFLIGSYSALGVPFFPWKQQALLIYLAFTDAEGHFPLRLRITDGKGQVIKEHEANLYLSLRHNVPERAFVLVDVNFPEPGEYRVQLFTKDLLLRERGLRLMRSSTNGHLAKSH